MRDQLEWTEFKVDFNEGAKRFESGTLNAYGITALGASLEILLETGMDEVERRYIHRVLEAVGGNKTLAAQVLGFDRRTLYRKLERVLRESWWETMCDPGPASTRGEPSGS